MIFKVIPEEKQLVEEKIEGEILADFERRFPASAVLICIFLSQSERDL